jgi:hypothetical protein
VSLPEHYARDLVEQVAKAIVADLIRQQPVNAIGILFYGPNTSTESVYDVALVDWAPNGRWEEAPSVRAGDYSSFRYSVSYNASTEPTSPARTRTPPARQSTRTGARQEKTPTKEQPYVEPGRPDPYHCAACPDCASCRGYAPDTSALGLPPNITKGLPAGKTEGFGCYRLEDAKEFSRLIESGDVIGAAAMVDQGRCRFVTQ